MKNTLFLLGGIILGILIYFGYTQTKKDVYTPQSQNNFAPLNENQLNVDSNKKVFSITGNAHYPSDYIPEMNICVISEIKTKYCVNKPENVSSYTIKDVPAGNYLLYSESGPQKTYYTVCDHMYGDKSSNEPSCSEPNKWAYIDFNCSQDNVCKNAFLPQVIKLNSDVSLEAIAHGWYKPRTLNWQDVLPF